MTGESARQRLDIRFSPSPFCGCGMKAELKVVESVGKANFGRLYYRCPGNVCRFFCWVNPESATWIPCGLPVAPPALGVCEGDEVVDVAGQCRVAVGVKIGAGGIGWKMLLGVVVIGVLVMVICK